MARSPALSSGAMADSEEVERAVEIALPQAAKSELSIAGVKRS